MRLRYLAAVVLYNGQRLRFLERSLRTKKQLRITANTSRYILIYAQQDATLRSVLYLETALHISGGTTTHHQERKQLYLQHIVFVTPLLLPAAITARYILLNIYYLSHRYCYLPL
jgi:hypothetical protein